MHLMKCSLPRLQAIEKNNNILLLSSTGSGKPLAFLIPILQKLDRQIKKTQALIIVTLKRIGLTDRTGI
ncbi:MAG: DEAD/DEAH box helicase [Chitinophagaceae bacterium]